jgi:lipoprotein signal peptidase
MVDDERRTAGPPAHRAQTQRGLLATVFAVVIVTDQATKWLAWRHLDGVLVNDGGYILLGRAIRSWFARPAIGAVANAAGIILVLLTVVWVLRRRRDTAIVVAVGLLAAGWTSNLLDRCGLHAWSAPGSSRGVVDFIPSGGLSRCNVADLWIVLGLLILGWATIRRRCASATPSSPALRRDQ